MTTTITTTTTTVNRVCRSDQFQCTHCENHQCMGCNNGYVWVNGISDIEVPGGTCISTCIGKPPEPKPNKPSSPLQYNGKAWPQHCIDKADAHFFAIGDWGGDGHQNSGPGHTWKNPSKCDGPALEQNNLTMGANFVAARPCQDADRWAQKNVARQMKMVAKKSKPDYVINVGDNFYPGGIEVRCQTGDSPEKQFGPLWKQVYMNDPDLQGKPWLSVLGNHDYGGIGYMQGWDQQVFYSWTNDDWIMPAQYWSRRVQYRDFAVQFWFLESNTCDANMGSQHGICQGAGECYDMKNGATCQSTLQAAWPASIKMITDNIDNSSAEWHVLVTHHPPAWVSNQREVVALSSKIDLIIAGHTHYQDSGRNNDMQWILTGGGGGVTSDSGPTKHGYDNAYGFVDLKINRTHLSYDMQTWGGHSGEAVGKEIILKSATIEPKKQRKFQRAQEEPELIV